LGDVLLVDRLRPQVVSRVLRGRPGVALARGAAALALAGRDGRLPRRDRGLERAVRAALPARDGLPRELARALRLPPQAPALLGHAARSGPDLAGGAALGALRGPVEPRPHAAGGGGAAAHADRVQGRARVAGRDP